MGDLNYLRSDIIYFNIIFLTAFVSSTQSCPFNHENSIQQKTEEILHNYQQLLRITSLYSLL